MHEPSSSEKLQMRRAARRTALRQGQEQDGRASGGAPPRPSNLGREQLRRNLAERHRSLVPPVLA